MRESLKPYPAMKGSGVEWLGEVPVHWEVAKLRSILRNKTSRNHPDLPLLSVVREKGVIIRNVSDQESNHNFIPDDLSNYKVVRKGQFAMNKMKAWQGSYGVSQHEGIVSPAYFVFDLNGVSGDFFNRAIRSKAYIPSFTQASDGVRIGQWDLSQDRMREIGFSIPPLPEQAAIVRYLDYVERRVQRLVRAKRKLIALLTEQKQAIIHRAVTRGIAPDAPLKDSGVEWLGQVPAHWEVRRLKTLLAAPIKDGPHLTPDFLSQGIPFLSVDGIQNGELVFENCRYVSPESHAEFKKKTAPRRGDILLGKAASTGKIAQVKVGFEFSIWSPLALIRPNNSLVTSTFLESALKDISAQTQVETLCTLNTQKNISMNDIPKVVVPLPPLPEQAAIVKYLDQATAAIDTAITRAAREIELLNEYRTRLIADVVTGKLDVRTAAAALPESDTDDLNADCNQAPEEASA